VQVPNTLNVFSFFDPPIQTYTQGACCNTFNCILIIKFEILRSQKVAVYRVDQNLALYQG
jgi:hypothetical protein